GVAIAARQGFTVEGIVTNFGDGPVHDSGAGGTAAPSEDDFDPFDEARMLAATIGGLRFVSLYAPNGRAVGSPFYAGKLAWFERLGRWLDGEVAGGRGDRLVLGGDLNVAPANIDVWDAAAVHGGTHVSDRERAAFRALLDRGLLDAFRARHDQPGRYTWWDYRAGMFHKNFGMRIDHFLVSAALEPRVVDVEIDRQARKGPPIPSDHAPMTLDLDEPGVSFDPDWAGALARISARTRSR
ncbi:MAG: exodeoxyribonuclease III, partial [Candidatus Limnocylindrales bacterium]